MTSAINKYVWYPLIGIFGASALFFSGDILRTKWQEKQQERLEWLVSQESEAKPIKKEDIMKAVEKCEGPRMKDIMPERWYALENSATNSDYEIAVEDDYLPGMDDARTNQLKKIQKAPVQRAPAPVERAPKIKNYSGKSEDARYSQKQPNTRGVRNNNPGNIKIILGKKWAGQTGNDGDFCKFQTTEYGIAATIKNLIDYNRMYKIDTLRKVVERYAPRSENNTNSYVAKLSELTGHNPDTRINLGDKRVAAEIASKMFLIESNVVYHPQTIEQALAKVKR